MAISTTERETILQAIAAWPPEEQIALAHTILQHIGHTGPLPPQEPSWRQLAGLAAPADQPAPSDAEVARWLDEHRSEKYG